MQGFVCQSDGLSVAMWAYIVFVRPILRTVPVRPRAKLLFTAYRKSCYEELIDTKMNDPDLCLEVV